MSAPPSSICRAPAVWPGNAHVGADRILWASDFSYIRSNRPRRQSTLYPRASPLAQEGCERWDVTNVPSLMPFNTGD